MSYRKISLSFLTAALGLGIFVVGASAQEAAAPAADAPAKAEKPGKFGRRGPGRGEKFGHRGGMMGGFRGIQLTDAQKEQMKAIHEANKPNEATRTEMRSLMEAKRSGSITEEQKARLQSLRSEQRTKMESVRMQVEAILTPEQKAQIEKNRAEMKQRREEFRKNHPGKRQAPPADSPATSDKPSN